MAITYSTENVECQGTKKTKAEGGKKIEKVQIYKDDQDTENKNIEGGYRKKQMMKDEDRKENNRRRREKRRIESDRRRISRKKTYIRGGWLRETNRIRKKWSYNKEVINIGEEKELMGGGEGK